MAAVDLHSVAKSFGDVDVIGGFDLSIEQGEFVAFVGPSGSGKSTMLRMIAGLETVSGGRIMIDGADVTYAPPADRGIAMVFQSYALYPHLNVFENMAFNLRLAKMGKAEIGQRIREAAGILQIDALLERRPSQLSGGQKQRVAIGRAIVRHPKVFLFDEPLSNLDAALRVEMRLEIEKLHNALGATMIYVTHDQVEAMTLSDRIVALDGGAIQQIGPPMELYDRPGNHFVAGFIGSPKMNFMPATVARIDGDLAYVEPVSGDAIAIALNGRPLRPDQKVVVGFRPEAITMLPADAQTPDGMSVLRGHILTIEHLGNVNFGYVEAGLGAPIAVQIIGRTEHQKNDAVIVALPPGDCHVFDGAGSRPAIIAH